MEILYKRRKDFGTQRGAISATNSPRENDHENLKIYVKLLINSQIYPTFNVVVKALCYKPEGRGIDTR
jgi:hypothetical protein